MDKAVLVEFVRRQVPALSELVADDIVEKSFAERERAESNGESWSKDRLEGVALRLAAAEMLSLVDEASLRGMIRIRGKHIGAQDIDVICNGVKAALVIAIERGRIIKNPKAWIGRVAANQVVDHVGKCSRYEKTGLDEEVFNAIASRSVVEGDSLEEIEAAQVLEEKVLKYAITEKERDIVTGFIQFVKANEKPSRRGAAEKMGRGHSDVCKVLFEVFSRMADAEADSGDGLK